MTKISKKYFWLLIISLFFIPIGLFPLFDLDEGAFAEATREMLSSGDWLTPYLHGTLRSDKPILIYWLQILSTKIFGFNEFGLRFPSACLGLVWLYTIYSFVNYRFNKKIAMNSVMFSLSSLLFMIITKAATADATFNMFLCLSLLSMWHHFETRDQASLLLCYGSLGLGILTKGPVAVLIPLLVSFIYFIYHRHYLFWLKSITSIKGWLVMLVIALPWYIYQYISHGWAFLNGFIMHHNIDRFNQSFEGHSGGVGYYIVVLILCSIPLTRLVLLPFQVSKIRSSKPLEHYLWTWFMVVLILFTFAQTKLPHYLLYGLTPIFILSAIHLKSVNRWWITAPLLFILLLFLIILLPGNLFHIQDIDILIKNITIWHVLILLCLIASSLLSLFYIERMSYFLWSQVVTMMGFIYLLVIPIFSTFEQLPIKHAAHFAKDNDLNVFGYRMTGHPSFSVYRELPLKQATIIPGQIILTKDKNLADFNIYNVLFRENHIVLIQLGEVK
ncbi:MAG: ArnT family glycosyltransferase [Candidatus Comchoanobacterales bacterium]